MISIRRSDSAENSEVAKLLYILDYRNTVAVAVQ